MAMITKSQENATSSESDGAVEQVLDEQRPRHARRGAEDEHGPGAEVVEIRARDGGLHEVRAQPGFDALGLARADVILQAAKLAVTGDKKHAFRCVLVERFHEIFHGLGGHIHVRCNLDFHDLGRRECLPKCEHVRRAADEDDALADPAASYAVPIMRNRGPLANEQEDGGQRGEDRHDGAAVHAEFEEVRTERNDEPEDDACATELDEAPADCFPFGVFVKSLGVEAQRAEWNEDEEQPLEFRERENAAIEEAEFHAVEADPMRAPKGGDQQKRVNDLEELQIEFLTATEHCRGAKGGFLSLYQKSQRAE